MVWKFLYQNRYNPGFEKIPDLESKFCIGVCGRYKWFAGFHLTKKVALNLGIENEAPMPDGEIILKLAFVWRLKRWFNR
jgi:hypothetical protein